MAFPRVSPFAEFVPTVSFTRGARGRRPRRRQRSAVLPCTARRRACLARQLYPSFRPALSHSHTLLNGFLRISPPTLLTAMSAHLSTSFVATPNSRPAQPHFRLRPSPFSPPTLTSDSNPACFCLRSRHHRLHCLFASVCPTPYPSLISAAVSLVPFSPAIPAHVASAVSSRPSPFSVLPPLQPFSAVVRSLRFVDPLARSATPAPTHTIQHNLLHTTRPFERGETDTALRSRRRERERGADTTTSGLWLLLGQHLLDVCDAGEV